MGVHYLSIKKSLRFGSVKAGTTQQECIVLALLSCSSLDMYSWLLQETGSRPSQSIGLAQDSCSYILV